MVLSQFLAQLVFMSGYQIIHSYWKPEIMDYFTNPSVCIFMKQQGVTCHGGKFGAVGWPASWAVHGSVHGWWCMGCDGGDDVVEGDKCTLLNYMILLLWLLQCRDHYYYFFGSAFLRDCSLCWDRWNGTWRLHFTRPCGCDLGRWTRLDCITHSIV